MTEQVRSIEITVKVDTNKRTFAHVISADSLDDALAQVREDIDDIRWSLL